MARDNALGLPLLTKEMIEHASRRRTYIIRSVYAILLFGFALLIFWGSVYSNSNHPFELLGKGRQMFFILMVLQMIGIMLFTPALTCGSITSEKEQNTYCLLILTKLGPWTILSEKYLSRLIMMLTYLLISLPLFGFCYALGGIEQVDVWAGFASLFVTVLQLSAIGLFCSSYFRTTVGSFIASYIIGASVLFVPMVFGEVFRFRFVRVFGNVIWRSINRTVEFTATLAHTLIYGLGDFLGISSDTTVPNYSEFLIDADLASGMMFCAPILVIDAIENTWSRQPLWEMLCRNIPAIFSAMFFFSISRFFVIRRAFVAPTNYLYSMFRSIDGMFQRLNQNRFTKGMVLIDDKNNLPDDEPIAWRETTKTALGRFRYLVRIFLVLEFPVLILCMLAIITSVGSQYRNRNEALSALSLVCWIIAILLVSVKAATLVSKERSHETLDVLLSTPLSSDAFVRQKFKGVRRLMIVVAIPLLTTIFAQTWIGSVVQGSFFSGLVANFFRKANNSVLFYLIVQTLCVFIYLPMIAWLSFLAGLRIKTQSRAIFTALAIIVAWLILPVVILFSTFEALNVRPGSGAAILLLSTPLAVPMFNEVGDLDDLNKNVALVLVLNTMLYGGMLLLLRTICLRNAARMLGRSEA